MLVKSVRVLGFQSFSDSGEIQLNRGFNLIVGQNNSGKSALLRAMRLSLPDDRHRSPAAYEEFQLPRPEVQFGIDLSGPELREIILRSGYETYVPINREDASFVDNFLNLESISFQVVLTAGVDDFTTRRTPSHGIAVDREPPVTVRLQGVNGRIKASTAGVSGQDSLPTIVYFAWRHWMFYFSAERYGIGKSNHGHARRLEPDARNLPAVLHTMMNERGSVFARMMDHLREIFPTVGNVSVAPVPGDESKIEIRVWPTQQMDDVNLSFPLEQSGTGVAQILALLTAVMTISRGVIMIDEINSFLHPAAAKALLRILQSGYSQHQYIISTHAPEVIGFSNSASILMVRREGYVSSVERLNLMDVENLREVATHLGVAMTDVFSADYVVWVEGATEELCFPYVYSQAVGPMPRGMRMLAVAATGDFMAKRRDRHLIFEIYSRLTSASATMTISVAFSFDSETLTGREKEEMQRESNGAIHFLPRRHLECYLLDPDALAVLIRENDEQSAYLTAERVSEEIRTFAGEQRFGSHAGDLDDVAWLSNVDAARLISAVVGRLTEHRFAFTKKEQSLRLIRHLLEHKPEALAELVNYVRSLVEGR